MTYYYNPTTHQIAKVLGVDDRTHLATIVIDDKSVTMDWHEFIKQFKSLAVKDDKAK